MNERIIDTIVGGWVSITISEGGDLPYSDKPFKTVVVNRHHHGRNSTYEQWHRTIEDAQLHAQTLLEQSNKLHRGDDDPPNYR
ncbi:hypothetical protein Y900_004210 [Mycolicibacterium aromaticivorans JS19b1 = JCM 16368]|uniref:Uncharacterized protein n=1 Tax=Mycolicibacterium aromaticivorans JS19b1 = JCM 16368 TaxID=1440774 RepID=Z5X588_9MYCO|nr:hypothetical protein [Mycolicibacterium aromaticivorans]KDE98168.1 hypothetical protein Y900_004210 [Mycolicibacterium aromaticivorans JS19b1 = JCM 16368]